MKPNARSSIRHRAIASIVLACLGCGVYLLSLSGRAPSASKPTSNGKADRNKRSCTWPGLGFQSSGRVGLLLSSSSSQGWGLFKIELTLLVRNSSTVTTLPFTLYRVRVITSITITTITTITTIIITIDTAAEIAIDSRSVVDVICSTADLAVFCKVIQSATRSPHVARLMDPQLHATVFAPTDRAFNEDEARLGQLLGVSGLAQLLTSPRVAAELVASHVITDHIVKEAQLLQERLFHNLLGHTLEVDASTLDGGLHIRGPASSVRLCSGPAPQVPLQASASIIYRVEGVLAARFPALPSFRAATR
ncbi:hypothetical protein QJQ45_027177 [Haematococcus lacustris]|nr:hypothetical protein QJQ45_027177 [Haematococcus lacustris]